MEEGILMFKVGDIVKWSDGIYGVVIEKTDNGTCIVTWFDHDKTLEHYEGSLSPLEDK
jgi:uncharacterized protein YkvS